MTDEQKKFWMEVYIAAIRAGYRQADYFADRAVEHLKERENV